MWTSDLPLETDPLPHQKPTDSLGNLSEKWNEIKRAPQEMNWHKDINNLHIIYCIVVKS